MVLTEQHWESIPSLTKSYVSSHLVIGRFVGIRPVRVDERHRGWKLWGETSLRRSIVMHNLHTRVCTHKVRLWWFDTQLSFNRGLIFDWCIGENVGWRELSKILKQKTKLDDSHKIHYWLTKGLGSLIWGHQKLSADCKSSNWCDKGTKQLVSDVMEFSMERPLLRQPMTEEKIQVQALFL